MIEQPYPYYVLEEKTQYIFISIGEKSVAKIVFITPLRDNIWNLGFGDLEAGGFVNDSVVTNNQDALKVVRTVAKIAIDFLAKYPDCELEINPVDEKRKRLYNNIFRKYFKEILPVFTVIATFGEEEENYSSLKYYDLFRIKFKS